MVMVKTKKPRLSIELIFVMIALVAGSFVALRMHPLFGSDEIVHFPRAYHVAEGNLWTERLTEHDYGGYVPEQIKDFNNGFQGQVHSNKIDQQKLADLKQKYGKEKLDTDGKRVPLSFTSAGVYSAWAYGPSALGVKIARVLDLPLIWYVYLGRLACLAIWIALTFVAIRLLPSGKLFLLVIALLPTSLVQATTMGMDGIVNGLSWLLIAITFAVFAGKTKLDKPKLLVIGFLSLYLATTKQGYLPIAALPLIIPPKLWPIPRQTANYLRIGFGVLLGLVTVWYLRKTGPIAGHMHFIQRPGLNVNSQDQLAFIFSHPLQTLLIICLQPFSFAWASIYAGFVGVLTNKLIFLPVVVMVLLYVGLIAAGLHATPVKKEVAYSKRLLLCAAGVLFGTYLAINLALYVSFTQVGLNRVEGVQGRYLLPLIPLALVFPMLAKRQYFPKWQKQFTLTALFCVALGLISTIIVTG